MMDLICRRGLTNLTFELLPPIILLQPAIQGSRFRAVMLTSLEFGAADLPIWVQH